MVIASLGGSFVDEVVKHGTEACERSVWVDQAMPFGSRTGFVATGLIRPSPGYRQADGGCRGGIGGISSRAVTSAALR